MLRQMAVYYMLRTVGTVQQISSMENKTLALALTIGIWNLKIYM